MEKIEKEAQKCQICNKKDSKYKCPKCNINYCSLGCYKTHNSSCTESFYEENVIELMKSTKSTDEEKKKINKLLKEQISNDNNGILNKKSIKIEELEIFPKNLKARLQKLNEMAENNKITINSLTPEEQKNLLTYVRGITNFSNNFPEWVPWWEQTQISNSKITEITDLTIAEKEKYKNLDLNSLNDFDEYDENEENNENTHETQDERIITENSKIKSEVIKLRLEAIPNIKILFKNPVNEQVKFHIVNTIYPLIFYCRFYNGDLLDDSENIVLNSLEISDALKSSERHKTIGTCEIAISYALENLIKIEGKVAKEFKIRILYDLVEIWKSSNFVIEGLLRLFDLFHFVETKQTDKKYLEKISKAKNKLIFFTAYVRDEFQFFGEAVQKNLEIFKFEANKSLENAKQMKNLQSQFQKGVLINEIE